MNISEEGLVLIKSREGLRLKAYQDQVGIWTIGWGHTKGVEQGDTITEEQAEAILENDLEKVYKCISNSISIPLTQGQFDALCSWIFNLGCGTLRTSTILEKLNSGDELGAIETMMLYNHAGGKINQGLVERREAEKTLFLA